MNEVMQKGSNDQTLRKAAAQADRSQVGLWAAEPYNLLED